MKMTFYFFAALCLFSINAYADLEPLNESEMRQSTAQLFFLPLLKENNLVDYESDGTILSYSDIISGDNNKQRFSGVFQADEITYQSIRLGNSPPIGSITFTDVVVQSTIKMTVRP